MDDDILDEIIDHHKLYQLFKCSLQNFHTLKKLERFIEGNDVCWKLEYELMALLKNRNEDNFAEWLCSTLKRLSVSDWTETEEKAQLMAAICVSFIPARLRDWVSHDSSQYVIV